MTDENYIALICNGGFDVIPDISIGELFETNQELRQRDVVRQWDGVFVCKYIIIIQNNMKINANMNKKTTNNSLISFKKREAFTSLN